MIRSLTTLPGVGERTASRFSFYLLDHPDEALAIARAASELQHRVRICACCFNLADPADADGLCSICTDPNRQAREGVAGR